MELMLNGKLVTCNPGEYRQLLSMGLITDGQSTTSSTAAAAMSTEPVENSPEAPKIHMMFACRVVDGSSQYIQDATGECTFTPEPADAMLYTSLDLADRMAARLNEPSFGHPFEVEAVPVMVL